MISPRACDGVAHQIAIADRTAAGKDDDVVIGERVEHRHQVGDRVRPPAHGSSRLAAVPADERRQREPVDVVHLAGAEGPGRASEISLPVETIATVGRA